MQRLGKSYSRPSEWEKSSAFYSRLTLSSSTGISRPQLHYPQPLSASGEPIVPSDGLRMFRTELFDIGHARSYYELCKYSTSINIWYFTELLRWSNKN